MRSHIHRRPGAHLAKRATRPTRTIAGIAKLSGTGVLASGAVLALGTAFATPSYASTTTSTCNATGFGSVSHSTSHTGCYAYNHSTAGASASSPYDNEGFPPSYAEAGNHSTAHSTIVGDSQATSYAYNHSTASATATSGPEGEANAYAYANHDSSATATARGTDSSAYASASATDSHVTTTATNGGRVSVSTNVSGSTGYGLARGDATGYVTTSDVYGCSSSAGGYVIAFTSTGTLCVSADGHTTTHG